MTLKLHNKRMLQAMDYFKELGVLNKDFLKSIGMDHGRNVNKIKAGEMGFTIEHIAACIKTHGINPGYFFKRDEPMYKEEQP